MAGNKPPVLTSPAKVGFFVSLMLVLVGIGVTYLLFRTFGLSWGWISPGDEMWIFRFKAGPFLREMVPLAGLVAVIAWFSFVLITRAVRQYKSYVDSGTDYKNLLASIREVEDLEDKSQIDNIKYHPELKEFLLNMRHRLLKKIRELEEREKFLVKSAVTSDNVVAADFKKQTIELTEAIQRISRGGQLELPSLTVPELKKLEAEIRLAVQNARPARVPAAGGDDIEGAFSELLNTAGLVRSRMPEIVKELDESSKTAKKLEEQLNALTTELAQPGEIDAGVIKDQFQSIRGLVGSIETISASLDELGEEAKGIAINAAMNAGSGQGTQSDLIQIAEDVKSIASRFNEIALSFTDEGKKLKAAMGSIDGDIARVASSSSRTSNSAQAAAAAAGTASLWVERIMLLTDKINSLHQAVDQAVGSVKEAPETPAAPEPVTRPEGFETADDVPPIFGHEEEPAPEPETSQPPKVPGIEKERSDFFAEVTSENEFFADLGEAEKARGKTEPKGLELEDRPTMPTKKPVETDTLELEETPIPFTANAKDTTEEPETDSPADLEDNVIDLYALGAVDYDPAQHTA